MADILVNSEQWNSISEKEKEKITEGLRQVGALRSEDQVKGDPAVVPFDENTQLAPMWNPIKDICKALCDTTAAAGAAWCTANTAGVGLAVCLAAAEVARHECRNRC
ncbi:hypothetical protein EOJ32_19855 (plasmid) [Paracoccus sp. Arc7-R13]|uniref:hypothetical protein n=1 Tax=Paracoccus sp. Arc7-R13 TaxID=2500532 RepID=UPI000FDAC9BA|nr:hypothetical protein [Paracoccus sp. Arc7-R13]AZY96048.1 hypothetical protein EOJ32_19855 [Paracoccus sp. Arc7-R13]